MLGREVSTPASLMYRYPMQEDLWIDLDANVVELEKRIQIAHNMPTPVQGEDAAGF